MKARLVIYLVGKSRNTFSNFLSNLHQVGLKMNFPALQRGI
jgi:hypothetical protein